MSEGSQSIDPVLDLLGGENIVAHRPSFARAFGGACAGLLLSQFWFYSRLDTSAARDGWFYASQEQIEEETGLTRTEQETARRKLRDAGILAENKAGIPARLYFRLDKSLLVEQLRHWIVEDAARARARDEKKQQVKEARGQGSGKAASLYAENLQTGMRKSRKQERGKAASKHVLNPQPISDSSLKGTEMTLKGTQSDVSASLFPDQERKEPEQPKAKTPEWWAVQDTAYARAYCRRKGIARADDPAAS